MIAPTHWPPETARPRRMQAYVALHCSPSLKPPSGYTSGGSVRAAIKIHNKTAKWEVRSSALVLYRPRRVCESHAAESTSSSHNLRTADANASGVCVLFLRVRFRQRMGRELRPPLKPLSRRPFHESRRPAIDDNTSDHPIDTSRLPGHLKTPTPRFRLS